MTTYSLEYRMTLYAPRSVDPAETTILTPPGGAVHSDAFKVTTMNTLAGWKPYLGFPRGRTGRVNALERTTDVGTMTFEVNDAALVPGTNANRWVSAFLGNASGDPQLGGLKCFVEESTDGGTSWAAFWTGYVKALSLKDRRWYSITVRDMTHELTKLPLFGATPHSSIGYAARPMLMPLGVTGAGFGTIPTAPDLVATAASPVILGGSTVANVTNIILARNDVMRKDNFVTKNLLSSVAPDTRKRAGFSIVNYPNFNGTCRAHVTWNGGANQGDFKVGHLTLTNYGGIGGWIGRALGGGHAALVAVMIQPLDNVNDLNYSALPANGTAVTIRMFADQRMEEGAALLLEVANPLTLLADILAGKFSQVYRWPEQLPPGKAYGDVRRSFANTVSTANQLELPPARFVIDKPSDNALEWIQNELLKPYGLALVCSATGSFSVVDLRLPSALGGLPTIVDDDLDPADQPGWDYDRDAAIFKAEGVLWEDFPLQYDALKRLPDDYPEMTKLLLNSLDHPLTQLAIGSGDFGEKTWKMGGGGYRMMEDDAALSNRSRTEYLQQKMLEQMNLIRRPYSHGATTTSLKCRRTATIVGLLQGQVVIVNVAALPNPSTGKRGGSRVCRVVEITRDLLSTDVRLLDLGIATVATAPTFGGSPALGSDPRHSATIAVTLNGTFPAEVRFALTNGGAVPADNSAAWHFWEQNPLTASGTITLTGLTPGMRLWVQARTMPNDRAVLLMPSVWATSASLDLTAYANPSAVVVNPITARSALVSWTNGATDLFISVWLRSPDSGAYTRVATLLPGSTSVPLWDLTPSTAYGVQVLYFSMNGVVSGAATASFSTTASEPVTQRPPVLRRPLL